jgi:hypothetical protein
MPVSVQFHLSWVFVRCNPPTKARIPQSTYIKPEYGGSMFLRNVRNDLKDYNLSQPKKTAIWTIISVNIFRHIFIHSFMNRSTALCWALASSSVPLPFLYSRWDSLDGGWARHKAATYTQDNTRQNKRTRTSMSRVGYLMRYSNK